MEMNSLSEIKMFPSTVWIYCVKQFSFSNVSFPSKIQLIINPSPDLNSLSLHLKKVYSSLHLASYHVG